MSTNDVSFGTDELSSEEDVRRLLRSQRNQSVHRLAVIKWAKFLGQRNAQQFQWVLNYAIEEKIEVAITILNQVSELSTDSLHAYLAYFHKVGNVSESNKLTLRVRCLCEAITCDIDRFSHWYDLITRLKLEQLPVSELESKQFRMAVLIFDTIRRASQHLRYEQLVKLEPIINTPSLQLLVHDNLSSLLNRSVHNSDGRMFDYWFQSLTSVTLETTHSLPLPVSISQSVPSAARVTDQVRSVDPDRVWYASPIDRLNIRSALKLIKFEVSINGFSRFWDTSSLRQLSLLGMLKDRKIVDGLTIHSRLKLSKIQRKKRVATLLKITEQSNAVLACLSRLLPSVLVDLVLSYLEGG